MDLDRPVQDFLNAIERIAAALERLADVAEQETTDEEAD